MHTHCIHFKLKHAHSAQAREEYSKINEVCTKAKADTITYMFGLVFPVLGTDVSRTLLSVFRSSDSLFS